MHLGYSSRQNPQLRFSLLRCIKLTSEVNYGSMILKVVDYQRGCD